MARCEELVVGFLADAAYVLQGCRVDVEQAHDGVVQVGVEICEFLPVVFLVEGSEILFVIVEIWCLPVAAGECVPVPVPPVAVLGDEYLAYGCCPVRIDDGYAEGEGSVGRVNTAAVHTLPTVEGD